MFKAKKMFIKIPKIAIEGLFFSYTFATWLNIIFPDKPIFTREK